MSKQKWIYSFGEGTAEGTSQMKNLLGGKGAGLAEMSKIGLPVPSGFTITTEVCTYFYENNKYPPELQEQLNQSVALLEKRNQKKFGDPKAPLLVSVRSGSRVSMPGMMDTVLNLGLNDETAEGMAKITSNGRFAYDSYRRFIQMYSNIVLNINLKKFETELHHARTRANVKNDYELSEKDLRELIKVYKRIVLEESKAEFPQNPQIQLLGAIGAVFQSWMNDRAITYRKLNDIPGNWGTAVTVQSMVFGNWGNDSATGVAFTRNPSTGDKNFYGEYLINAQGEDVVAGIRTPQQITIYGKLAQKSNLPAMEETMPELFKQLNDVRLKLESHYKDMQDIEFTIQSSKLYILQTRNGKRTSQAAVKIAIDLCNEGVLTRKEAIMSVSPNSLNQLLHPTLDPKAEKNVLTVGLPASPGACSGIIVLNAEDAVLKAKDGAKVILVRAETSPEDIHGMHAAQGILTSRGGMTSHAAVVARGMGRPCVCGAGEIVIKEEEKTLTIGKHHLKVGDLITLDGGTGQVILGKVPTAETVLSNEYHQLMSWADEVRRLKIRANAETPLDASVARKFGAEGIGLCRTEHMFFNPKRILAVRRIILAESDVDKKNALEELLPMQVSDFVELFKIMKGYPVTIRLLDPPLHEFLPKEDSDFQHIAELTKQSIETIKNRAHSLKEENPMLGNRGVRLGITRPEIYEMQVRAIFMACVRVLQETGEKIVPEIMIPLAFGKIELDIMKKLVDSANESVSKSTGVKLQHILGTMIELPRACIVADEIAKTADFFSFGTNDLTQTTFGISRDDAASFITKYKEKAIVENDPFASLDVNGVGELMKLAVNKGRNTKSHLKLGICGEHGGDPKSITFADIIGLDYVSCSPFRIPIARLAAAQASIINGVQDSNQAKPKF